MEKLLALVLLLLIIPKAVGQRENLDERILKLINTETDQYRRIYRDLHKNPELSTMEFETSGKMAEELKSIGFDVTSGVGGTGVVGIFKNGEGKVIMLRTDMDALPVI